MLLLRAPLRAQDARHVRDRRALDRVIAIVNDGIVLPSQLDTQSALIEERLRNQNTQMPPPDVIRQQVLDAPDPAEIQVQRANRLGVQVSDETLNEALRDVAKRNNIPFEQMPAALEQQGIDYATYREEMRREITLHCCASATCTRASTSRRASSTSARAATPARRTPNTEFDVSHILLSLPRDRRRPRRWRRSRSSRTRSSIERPRRGLRQLALAYSKSQSALERGKLGWRPHQPASAVHRDLVAAMKPAT
jgi:peptidyl-prolyl cis-trans isomerase SurA